MPAIHTQIPSSVLPTELAESNKITTEYESYTLIPRMGPLSYSYYRRKTVGYMREIIYALDFFKIVNEHQKQWRVLPHIPLQILSAPEIINTPQLMDTIDLASIANAQPTLSVAQPRENLSRLRRLNPEALAAISRVINTDRKEKNNEARIESHKSILAMVARPNAVVSRLVETGHLLTEKGLVDKRLLGMTQTEQLKLVVSQLRNENVKTSRAHQSLAKNIIMTTMGGRKNNFGDLGVIIKKSPELMKDFIDAVAERFKRDWVLETVDSIDDSVISSSREWAFLRKERVELELETPKFRGPLSVNSVAPNSELSLTQSQSFASQTHNISSSQSSSSLTGNNLISNQIKQNMGTLFDYGSNLGQTMSEEGYEKDNSRGEKRTIVESTLSQISEANATQTLSVNSASSSQLREYRTEGKDTNFATSEVSFEAFTPVKVTHYLDEIGTVWCPRVRNPYHKLKNTIDEFADKIESEYIAENYVVDPAEPIATYEGIDRISVNTPKVRDSSIEDGETYTHEVTIRLSEAQRNQGYFLSSDVQCSFKQDDDWSTDALGTNQYRIIDPVVLVHVENSHIKIRTKFKIIDENTFNPDSVWLKVSVTKFKYTQSYLEQIKEYKQTATVVNPARRNAVKAQAKKYARLKKEELIRKYESNIRELQDYTFITLMKQMFDDGSAENHWSYYHGIIKTCIDWDRARIEAEPASPEDLTASGLSPYHFLNVDAVRFFLPIHEGSEGAFFDAVSNTTDADWEALFDQVKQYINTQRSLVKMMKERMSNDDKQQLTLDSYDSELVLGRHLESVLSNHPFIES